MTPSEYSRLTDGFDPIGMTPLEVQTELALMKAWLREYGHTRLVPEAARPSQRRIQDYDRGYDRAELVPKLASAIRSTCPGIT